MRGPTTAQTFLERIAEIVRVRAGMSVAEMGAGRGRLTRLITEAAGASGHIFAIEPDEDDAAHIQIETGYRNNIHVVESPPHATPIASDSCDRVIMANIWTELQDPVAALDEARRLLRDDGRLMVIEWHMDADSPPAPPPQFRIGFDAMVQVLERRSWDILRHGNVGPYNYFIEAAISDESVQS